MINQIATYSKVIFFLFHENVLLLSTNIHPTFWPFVYDSAEKQMLNAISLVIEQRKNEFDRIAKVRIFPIYVYALREWYHFPDTCRGLLLAAGGPSWPWSYSSWIYNYLCNQCLLPLKVVSSRPVHFEVYSIQHYVIKFGSDLRQVGGFLRVLWFPSSIKYITEILLKVALNTINQPTKNHCILWTTE